MSGAPRVVGVIGPSGVGKDSLIAALAASAPGFRALQRVVTRPADETEPFRSVTEAEFKAMAEAGAFALHWSAHRLRYGVPRAEIAALGPGETGLVNLSRSVLAEASRVLPGFAVLQLTAPPEVLALRLSDRGRETGADIAARLARPAPALPEGLEIVVVDNGGTLDQAVRAASRALSRPSGRSSIR
ncbi:phosphonate metabolism protein/1,5-bisphosphokinase (PRPP-forming) PhnN [Jannaschia formosa]|uniref:phosphonate metabolism protein/1,5-bisphosphokinase (PRPP-forming) PhnN n=1 Tax=Jannaschia formosa TaxID=2259592 RepID=UPI000E1C0CAB|nr:phosphonate metabolism protein/1,5-bisphosphokinase (PRPP-forming) PhnN [Jannaschia formosa]TFL17709.1 phosphonate metabolism protein/1,5-bisphosphokinase (PRPP-forming) PhnN [Jannaschia formosa]